MLIKTFPAVFSVIPATAGRFDQVFFVILAGMAANADDDDVDSVYFALFAAPGLIA